MSKPKMKPQYSGPRSVAFWKRVNAGKLNIPLYLLGCALQDLEGRTLQVLDEIESRRKTKPTTATAREP